VERELIGPQPGHVRFGVHSCGVCHSDQLAVDGLRDNADEPVVPGHEIVGVINALGEGVTGWSVGDRVGVGFLGGPCTGATEDRGYAEVGYARATGPSRRRFNPFLPRQATGRWSTESPTAWASSILAADSSDIQPPESRRSSQIPAPGSPS
jgi:NADPH:quinone reductase-like Zn-dependent oxidoreductase